jgi:peptide-methionine (S)-S-oxide reductase
METATFAAGCFWGPEVTFSKVNGVTKTAVGYMGGHTDNPSYRDVCTGTSNHAEVVQVEFDPGVVSYKQLLDVFWNCHDPTQVNRQGPDSGTQYRTAIFCHTPEQLTEAECSKNNLSQVGALERPIATTIEPAPTFWRAEEDHQRFFEKRGMMSGH